MISINEIKKSEVKKTEVTYCCSTCSKLKPEEKFAFYKLNGLMRRSKQCRECRNYTSNKYFKKSETKEKARCYNNARRIQLKNSLKILKILHYAFTQCEEEKKNMILKTITPFINATVTHAPQFCKTKDIFNAHKVWCNDLKKFTQALNIKI